MIAKGTLHNSGARLAAYMVTGKDGEKAQLYELRGFASADIRAAFRDVDAMTTGTRVEKPFFHVQVRNPEGEELSRLAWQHVAERIESKLGYSGQPRAIAFHTDEKTGHEHMHIAWARLDAESLTAKPLPFFKLRLKETCRELESSLDLTRVSSERPRAELAPSRAEEEQSRRLNTDLHGIRGTIREAYEQSDGGKAFAAALADKGLTLCQGERRDFIVLDPEGGMHALGKRLLGDSAADIRRSLADLERDGLPTVAEAREHLAVARARPAPEPEQTRPSAVERARYQAEQAMLAPSFIFARHRAEPQPEPVRDAPAAERQPEQTPEPVPLMPKVPEPMTFAIQGVILGQDSFLSGGYHQAPREAAFEAHSAEAREQQQEQARQEQAARLAQVPDIRAIRSADAQARLAELIEGRAHGTALEQALEAQGLRMARVTPEEAQESRYNADTAEATGGYRVALEVGDLVAVNPWGRAYRLDSVTLDDADAGQWMGYHTQDHLPTLTEARAALAGERNTKPREDEGRDSDGGHGGLPALTEFAARGLESFVHGLGNFLTGGAPAPRVRHVEPDHGTRPPAETEQQSLRRVSNMGHGQEMEADTGHRDAAKAHMPQLKPELVEFYRRQREQARARERDDDDERDRER